MTRRELSRATVFPALLVSTALFFSGCSSAPAPHHAGMASGQTMPKPRQKALKIKWLSFEEGKKRALAENKLMVVDFWVSQDCPRCDMMAWKVWSNIKVIDLMEEYFIPVRVDLEIAMPPEAKALGEKYDYNFECLLLVCNSDGKAVEDNVTGRMCFSELITADWFITYLKQAAGIEDDFFSDME